MKNTLPSISSIPLKAKACFIFSSLLNFSQDKVKVKAKAFLLKGRKDPSVVGDTTVLELFFVLGLYFLRIVSLVIKLGRGVTTHWQLRRKGVEGIDEVTGCLLSRL